MTATLKVLETRPVIVNKEVIAALEFVLEKAQRGELIGIAISAVNQDNSVFRSWSTNDCLPTMVGAVAITLHRLIEESNHTPA